MWLDPNKYPRLPNIGKTPELNKKEDQELLRHAMRNRWNIPQEVRDRAMSTISEVLNDPESALRDKLSAIKTVLEADKINLKEEELEIKKRPKLHVHYQDMTREQLVEKIGELTGIKNLSDPISAIKGFLESKKVESRIVDG